MRKLATTVFGLTILASLTATAAAPATPPDGSSSPLVREVQERLQHRRHYEVGPVDGVFGRSTHIALWYYQEEEHLRTTGQMDRETLASLGLGTAARQMPAAASLPQVAQIWGEPPAGSGVFGIPSELH